jgi:hypothetical protein
MKFRLSLIALVIVTSYARAQQPQPVAGPGESTIAGITRVYELTPAQVQRLAPRAAAYDSANSHFKVFNRARRNAGQSFDPDSLRKQQQLLNAWNAEIRAVLTPRQTAKFDSLHSTHQPRPPELR